MTSFPQNCCHGWYLGRRSSRLWRSQWGSSLVSAGPAGRTTEACKMRRSSLSHFSHNYKYKWWHFALKLSIQACVLCLLSGSCWWLLIGRVTHGYWLCVCESWCLTGAPYRVLGARVCVCVCVCGREGEIWTVFRWPERDVSNYQFSKHYFALFKHITCLSEPPQATPFALQPVNNTCTCKHTLTHTHNAPYTAFASCLQLTNHHHRHHGYHHHHHTCGNCAHTHTHTHTHGACHRCRSSLRVNLHQCCFCLTFTSFSGG